MKHITESNLLLERVFSMPVSSATAQMQLPFPGDPPPAPSQPPIVPQLPAPVTFADLLNSEEVVQASSQLLQVQEYQEAVQMLLHISPSMLLLMGLHLHGMVPPGQLVLFMQVVGEQVIRDIEATSP